MALEATVFEQVDPYRFGYEEVRPWSYGFGEERGWSTDQVLGENNSNQVHHVIANYNLDSSSPSKAMLETNISSSTENCASVQDRPLKIPTMAAPIPRPERRKRSRRTGTVKNHKEVEHQRMTHIAVERNRRKQMNEYLSVLRSIIPASYVPRGDQASIVGGSINFLKELEQHLQSLEAQNQMKKSQAKSNLFSSFFTFPQYSMYKKSAPAVGEESWAIANVEVSMVESHAVIKLLAKTRPKQLLKLVLGLRSLHLILLHLNVITAHDMVLYCFSVQTEDDCELTSVNEIAASVYELIVRIQDG